MNDLVSLCQGAVGMTVLAEVIRRYRALSLRY